MTKELDVQVAQAMGWHWDDEWGCLIPPEQKAKPAELWTDWQYDGDDDSWWRKPTPGTAVSGIVYNGDMSKIILPEFGADIVASRTMERALTTPGQQSDYVYALSTIVTKGVVYPSKEWVWRMMSATPEQRCRAFLAAMGVDWREEE